MGVRFVETTVTIGGTSYETFNPDARTTAACAWSPASIRWGYTDSLEQPSPSTLDLPVTVPDGLPWPVYGDRVIVESRYQSYSNETGAVTFTSEPLVLFSGEVDGANRRRVQLTTDVEERNGSPRVEGWGIALTASGDFARLARARLADEPWPEQAAATRLRRIAELVAGRVDLGPDGSSIIGETGSNYVLRARDVDAFPALEAIMLAVAPEPNLLVEGHPGPRLAALYVLPQLVRDSAGGPAWIERFEDDPTATFWIDAGALGDGSRDLNVASVVNLASVRYPVPDPDRPGDYRDATFSVGDTASADLYGQSEWRLDTDALDAPDIMASRLRRAIAARAVEQWSLPTPTTVHLDRFAGPYIYRLLPSHPASPVLLVDAPSDVDPFQRSIGGTVTLHGDPRQQRLEVVLEPARNAVTKVVTLADLQDFPIDTLTAVTFRDLNTVSDAQVN